MDYMHAYRKLVVDQMAAKNMSRSDLVRDSGLSRQLVHRIVTDKRDRLTQPPDESTVLALAEGLNLEPNVIWAAVGVAMGLPAHVVPSITHEVRTASDGELLMQLASRLGLAITVRLAKGAEPAKADKAQTTDDPRFQTDEEGEDINPPDEDPAEGDRGVGRKSRGDSGS